MVTLEVHKTPCPSSVLRPVPSGVLSISRVVKVTEQGARAGHAQVTERHLRCLAAEPLLFGGNDFGDLLGDRGPDLGVIEILQPERDTQRRPQ